jgi:hypothetical protein
MSPRLVGPQLFERDAPLLANALIDDRLPLVRDRHRVVPLAAVVVIGLSQDPLPNREVVDAGGSVEKVAAVQIEDSDLGGNVVEQSTVLLELVEERDRDFLFRARSSSRRNL